MKKKILIIEKIHEDGLKLLDGRKDIEYELVENCETNYLLEKLKDCDAITLRNIDFNKELITAALKLKIISRHGVGYDNVDLQTAKERNIILAITPKANSVSVAEHVFFMMLNISRGFDMYDTFVREKDYETRTNLDLTKELWNKNILIIGFGRTGKSLIKRCIGFDMNVYVYDPYIEKELIKEYGGKKTDDYRTTIKNMDYISVHTPLTKETKNMINIEVLNSMKKSSILINTARGGVVNEKDLNEALNKNYIFGAGLDVYENEPISLNNPLLKNKKIFLTPHAATHTKECTIRMAKDTVQNIIDFFDNKLEQSNIIKL